MFNHNIKNNKYGFTLIELIVVITILLVLGTIAFIGTKSYLMNARDGVRVTDMTSISKGLETYLVNNDTLPLPEDYVEFRENSIDTIVYQGYVGTSILHLLNISNGGYDPVNNDRYFYSLNSTKQRYEILGFAEVGKSMSYLSNPETFSLFDKAFASDFSKRFGLIRGDYVGIFMLNNGTNTVVDKNTFNTGVINLSNTGTVFKVIFLDNNSMGSNVIGSGTSLIDNIKRLKNTIYPPDDPWMAQDYNCNKPVVTIGTQVWAGCNSTLGASIKYIGACKDYNGSSTSSTDCQSATAKENRSGINTSAYGYSASGGISDNIYGGLYDRYTINSNCIGTGLAHTGLPTSACPCPVGWHIPSSDEWLALEANLASYDIGWKSINPNSLKNKLGLTLAGHYDPNISLIESIKFENRGQYGGYLVSSTGFTTSFGYNTVFGFINFNTSTSKTTGSVIMHNGWSVRCLKNK
ncbi:MAG: FISUMP domain-containing protein [Candidatus Gracilibacteria bacterium]|nr:FISUMP domain-containing protein [Candidatus Gracilibacteria bacterium]MDD4530342.1 FISUMP domain-containing protein [Candidatus Gracilibacteria bacterium]